MIRTPYQELIEAEELVIKKTRIKYEKELDLFKSIFEEVCNFLSVIVPNTYIFDNNNELSKKYILVSLSSKMNLNSASIYNLIIKGYYVEAISLERTLLEDIQALIYIYYNPERITDWKNGKISSTQIFRFVNGIIVNTEGTKNVWASIVSPLYRHMSQYVHTSALSILPITRVNFEEQIIQLRTLPEYYEEFCQESIMGLISLQSIHIFYLKECFENIIKEKNLDISLEVILKKIGEFSNTYLNEMSHS